ncbi:MAG TPA: fumarylacetoacetate hydrolase family protein [Polyangiaceae bacterium]|nr:fumarylacetoacetate hydrolase family protein [Polyangiaceae bacterium]
MKLFRTSTGTCIEHQGQTLLSRLAWDDLFRAVDPAALVLGAWAEASSAPSGWRALSLVSRQEVWAAGVTYYRSRDARMEEAQHAAGGDFYARVYAAERPELFFKSTAHRVVADGGQVRLRADSRWNVPEPELTLAVSSTGRIFGYTIGNDMSSRDIEGENPLYLPQAKVYDGSCALGPCLVVGEPPPGPETAIRLEISRRGASAFTGETTLAQLKRQPAELAAYLFRDQSFPDGVFLMTGTGIVPSADFTLEAGDEIRIEIDGIGRLVNTVAS